MNEEKIINGYYQSNIKTSRNEDSVYAMKYASQQMMIDKLQNDKELLERENQELKKQLEESKDNYNCLLKQKEQFEYIMSKQVDYRGQQNKIKNILNNQMNYREFVDIVNAIEEVVKGE